MRASMHTILHIGAGQATELPEWLNTEAERIILVEPNPNLAEQLRQNTSSEPRVTVVEAAITSNPANNQLHEYNLPEASSLRPATSLKQLFPGLKTVNTYSVATLTPAQLMEQYGPEPGEPATLVLQAPGEEHAIIQALAEAEVLSYFSELWVTTNPEPLYEGSEAAETLLNTLQTLGYNVQQENQQDPDWPTWQLARDPQQDKIAALEKELQSLEQQLKESRTSLLDITHQKESLESQLTQARNQAAEAEKAKTAEAERANTAEQKLNQAEAAFSAKVQAEQYVRKQLEQLKQQLAEKEKQQQQQEENLAKQAEQLKALEQQLADIQQQKAKADQRAKSAEQALTEADKARREADKARNQAEKALAEEREQQKAREQKLSADLEALRQKAQELAVAREQLTEARDAHTKEQATHKQTTSALQESRKAIEEREQQLSKANQQLLEEKQSHQQTAKSLEDHKQWFQARKQQAEQQQMELAELKKQNEQLRQQLKQETEAHAQARKELATNTEKLAEQQTTNTKLDELEKKIASLGSNLTSHLDKKLTNTAKQIEDTLGLQNYLSTGELPLSYHGWPISPDLALYLTERLETQNYDLVIEFGSGTSTVLFAKVLMKKMLRHQTPEGLKRIAGNRNPEETHTWAQSAELPNNSDLPKRVLTFEHNEHYHEQTGAMLRQAGLEQVVDLVHAPLVDYSYQGDDYLYYDCDKALAKIAEIYEGRKPKILVLVDGPPGATGPNARFPALPKLINILSKARFDIVMDDYARQEEKNIFDNWKEILSKRGVAFSEKTLNFEKGACVLKVG